MVWFLKDPARAVKERQAVETLRETVHWLDGAVWKLEGSALRLDADIEAHGYVYPVKMVYPYIFPANPPTVWPRDESERWSAHQWGEGGELCLEWGPDTWRPEVTGAEVLASAHKLLSTENPKGTGQKHEVPSRHQATLGQELRQNRFAMRLLVTNSLLRQLAGLPPGLSAAIKTLFLMRNTGVIRALVSEVSLEGQETWRDPSLPENLYIYCRTFEGVALSTSLGSSDLRVGTVQDLTAVLSSHGLLDKPLAGALDDQNTFRVVLIRDRDGGLHPFLLPSPLEKLTVVLLGEDEPWRRSGVVSQGLQGKRVGLVGLGSAGSKISLALARSGVSRFVLVDDDVFLPENLVRHTLDWRDVGEHKVIGVKEQLRLCAQVSEVEVKDRPIQIAGQEATATAAGALSLLATCDLIVDATAEPRVFNQLALLMKSFPRALVWLEIYAGGIGGMIARSRPGKDPSPLQVRERLHAFLAEQGAPSVTAPAPYTAQGESGEPWIATDADVAVIADHAARLALDTLLAREPSTFPYSLYLIGLAREWLFTQPFHTIPIDVGPPRREQEEDVPSEVFAEGLEFIKSLLEKGEDGA